MTGVEPSLATLYHLFPTYPSLGLGQPRVQPWGVTPYHLLQSSLDSLLYGSLTLPESESEDASEDYGSSGGDVGRLDLSGRPSSNLTIMAPPGLSRDIGEVAKVYPVGQLASLGLPFLPSPKRFRQQEDYPPPPPPPPPFLRAPSKTATSRTSALPSSSTATTWRSTPPSSLSLA